MFNPEELGSLLISYLVLAMSFVFEGASWLKAVRQLRGEARSRVAAPSSTSRTTPDPTAKTVAFEDSAALIGIVLAAPASRSTRLTGQGFWDGLASVLIGLLLVGSPTRWAART